ncbi:MAG: sialate O-acetylesterase [Verrucomicrobia bacterium]|nr:sialate O-acetylesterase [Verrucomicrobiota bacterium]
MRPFYPAVLLLALVSTVRAEVTLAPLFTDHAVLQCDKPVPVWGRAAAGEKVAVSFRGQALDTVADAEGRWSVMLAPLTATGEAADFVVQGTNLITLHDVVVGEVWLASGQSNMEWPLKSAANAAAEIAAANFPLIRHLRIERTSVVQPAADVKTGGWERATPETAGGFTAVGYFFARDLHRKLGVPVGIVHSAWGGTPIESWIALEALKATSVYPAVDARWQKAVAEFPERQKNWPAETAAWKAAEEKARATHTKNPLTWPVAPAGPGTAYARAGLYNGMIAPLQPMALRGVIWYQGESNWPRASEYAELFSTLIRSWRAAWGEGELPFLFVQLPNYEVPNDPTGRGWAHLREAQAKALALPGTGMAVMIDAGEAKNLHPTNKQEPGRRLALLAKSLVYGLTTDCMGPTFVSATREHAALRVRFQHAATGLVAHNRPVQSLEIAGADKVFHPATGVIERGTLLVSSPAVKEPVAVRYAWTNAPTANLFNGSGLPAAPFRSDDW